MKRSKQMPRTMESIHRGAMAFALVALAATSWAQAPAAPKPTDRDPHSGERTAKLAQSLGLNEEQAEQLPMLMGERLGPLMREAIRNGQEPDIQGAISEIGNELGLDESQREHLRRMVEHRASRRSRGTDSEGQGFGSDQGRRQSRDDRRNPQAKPMPANGSGDDRRQTMMREHMGRQAREREAFMERLIVRLDLSEDQMADLHGFMREEGERMQQQFSERMRERSRGGDFGPNFNREGPRPGSSRGDFRDRMRDNGDTSGRGDSRHARRDDDQMRSRRDDRRGAGTRQRHDRREDRSPSEGRQHKSRNSPSSEKDCPNSRGRGKQI